MRFIIEISRTPNGIHACLLESGLDQPGAIGHVSQEDPRMVIRSTLFDQEDETLSDAGCGRVVGEELMLRVARYEELVNGTTPPFNPFNQTAFSREACRLFHQYHKEHGRFPEDNVLELGPEEHAQIVMAFGEETVRRGFSIRGHIPEGCEMPFHSIGLKIVKGEQPGMRFV